MKLEDFQGFWEIPGARPDTTDYLHFTAEGYMLNLVDSGNGPKDRWVSLWYSCQWNEQDELIVRHRDRASTEQGLTFQWADADTLVIRQAKISLFEWRYKRVPWTTMPAALEKAYVEGLRRIAADQSGKTPFA